MRRRSIPEGEQRRNVHERILELYCPVPSATDGTDYAFNTDVTEMSEGALKANLAQVKLRLLLDPSPCRWLLERFRLLAGMEEASHVAG